MKEEISNTIEQELKNIEINKNESINKEIENKVEEHNKKIRIIKLLKEAKENGQLIDYNDNMTLEELEEKAREIVITD